MPRHTRGKPGQRRSRTRLAHDGQFSQDRIRMLIGFANAVKDDSKPVNAEGDQEPDAVDTGNGDE